MHDVVKAGALLAGRYRLIAEIGHGAMGIVWRGRDELLERDVAVKEVRVPAMISSGDAAIVYQRTLREAKTAARLNHPGVVTVFDVVEEHGSPWIVMELVQARALDRIITEDGPLRPLAAAAVGECLLSALQCAHQAGVLHRDVKPSNVLIDTAGRAVLTDFGIATFEGDPALTQVGMVVGTPGFTAPERVRGQPATAACDLWSLGATLYAAVEGRGPFERAGGPAAVMAGIVNEKAPRAPSAGPLMPVIDALLRTDPAERPDAASAAGLLAEAARGARAGLALPGYPWPYGAVAGRGPAGGTRPDGGISPGGPAGDATTSACPVPPGSWLPGERPAFMTAGPPGDPQAPGEAGSADLPAFLDLPAFPGMPAFPGGTDFPDLPQRDGRPAPRPGPPPRRGRVLAASLAALVVLAAGAATGLAYAHSGGQPAAQGSAGLNLGTAGRTTGKAGRGGHGRAAAGHGSGKAHRAASNSDRARTSTTANAATGAAGSKPGQAASPGPAPGSPPAGNPPAGYRWYSVPAASSGAAAGFTIAVPDAWQATRQGLITYLASPAGTARVEINLTPFTFADPVREARLQQRQAIRQGLFPGYGGRGILPGTFQGAADADWRFIWRPGTGRMSALDVLAVLDTSAGDQPYALSVSSPTLDAGPADDTFRQMLQTFRPAP